MVDFSSHNEVLTALKDSQTVENDNRSRSREAHDFVDERNGQWEPEIFQQFENKPRYTFDQTSPIIEQIAGDIEKADFAIKVSPSGGEASKDTAKTLNGMIRNIQNISSATNIYNDAGRSMVTGGIAGWKVVQKFIDDDSFDQDLVIEPIEDFTNRVWFDSSAKRRDKADAKFAFDVVAMSKDEYKKQFPEGSESSVATAQFKEGTGFAPDDIFIGQLYWKKEVSRTLVLMSDGAVHEKDDDFEALRDELAERDITVEQEDGKDRERKRNKTIIMFRKFDGSDWLEPAKETVFSDIPLVPVYGNYKINNNQVRYRGVVEKLLDPQRVLNYSQSREIEEGALAPRAKYWMTAKQASGHASTLATMNTNADPIQLYTHDQNAPGAPQQQGGAIINQGLRTITEGMRSMFGFITGLFAANMGENPNLQSGVAIEKLQDRGDTGTIQYFSALEVAICYTAKVLINAIPRVYDTRRQERILEEDGTSDMVMLNEPRTQVTGANGQTLVLEPGQGLGRELFDNESQKIVKINDLSKGKYDVTCKAGPSFSSRQQEAVSGIIEVAAVDPSVIETGGDILLGNMSFPGSEQLAERKRAQLFQAGLIPVDQMTDEEKAQVQAAQQAQQAQGQQPSPEEMIGQAELMNAQNEQAKTQIGVQEKSANIQIAAQAEARKGQELALKAQDSQAKNQLAQIQAAQSQQQQQFSQFMDQQTLRDDRQAAVLESVTTLANALKTIQEAAQGPVVGPGFIENVREGSDLVTDAQNAADAVI